MSSYVSLWFICIYVLIKNTSHLRIALLWRPHSNLTSSLNVVMIWGTVGLGLQYMNGGGDTICSITLRKYFFFLIQRWKLKLKVNNQVAMEDPFFSCFRTLHISNYRTIFKKLPCFMLRILHILIHLVLTTVLQKRQWQLHHFRNEEWEKNKA